MRPMDGGVRISRMLHGKQRNHTGLPEALTAALAYPGRPDPLPPLDTTFAKIRQSSRRGYTRLHLARISFASTGSQSAIRFLLQGGLTIGSRCCIKSMTSPN